VCVCVCVCVCSGQVCPVCLLSNNCAIQSVQSNSKWGTLNMCIRQVWLGVWLGVCVCGWVCVFGWLFCCVCVWLGVWLGVCVFGWLFWCVCVCVWLGVLRDLCITCVSGTEIMLYACPL